MAKCKVLLQYEVTYIKRNASATDDTMLSMMAEDTLLHAEVPGMKIEGVRRISAKLLEYKADGAEGKQ